MLLLRSPSLFSVLILLMHLFYGLFYFIDLAGNGQELKPPSGPVVPEDGMSIGVLIAVLTCLVGNGSHPTVALETARD